MLVACTWNISPQTSSLSMRIASAGDSVSILPTIPVAFSSPLADTTVAFQFTPAVYGFYAILNSSRDTALIIVTDPLPGQTPYTIRLAKTANGVDGSSLSPSAAALAIVTVSGEHEPNGTRATADTLKTKIEGVIIPSTDTDLFVCAPNKVAAIVLSNTTGRTAFALTDGNGTMITRVHAGKLLDTLAVPSALAPPILVAVFAESNEVGGLYRLTLIPR